MEKNSRIAVFGHMGLVGSAILRKLEADGYNNLILRTKKELDLRDQLDVNLFFRQQQPQYVFITAALVGGIKANNTRRAEFIYDNLMIQSNVIHAAYKNKVEKLLFTGSACIYPKFYDETPITEDQLLNGKLEPTNEPYAVAKIAGVKMCQAYNAQYGCNFISVMPNNSFGIKDHYDLNNSHVLPALIRKIITAKQNNESNVEIWGNGSTRREFIYSDDMADALVFLMNNYDSPEIINIGSGWDITIREIAELIKKIVEWDGEFIYNNQLEGVKKRLLNSSKLYEMGWLPKVSLEEGLRCVINDIITNKVYANWK